MVEENKRQMATRLEERSFDVHKLTNNQLDMMNQLLIPNQELNRKEMEITNLRSKSDQLRNVLIFEKELLERTNKPSEAIRYFEELMRSPRSSSDISGLGHIKHSSSTKEGDSSKSGEKRNTKSKGKPTCHHCGKIEHTQNICRNKKCMQNPKPKFTRNCFNCNKQGHQAHECRSKISDAPTIPKF